MPVPQYQAVSELAEPDALDRTLNMVPRSRRTGRSASLILRHAPAGARRLRAIRSGHRKRAGPRQSEQIQWSYGYAGYLQAGRSAPGTSCGCASWPAN